MLFLLWELFAIPLNSMNPISSLNGNKKWYWQPKKGEPQKQACKLGDSIAFSEAITHSFTALNNTERSFFRVCFHPITILNICAACISWEIGSKNTQMFLHMNIRTFVTILSRKAQCNFPKMRGGVKSRLELFRKFIRFGNVTRPLAVLNSSIGDLVSHWLGHWQYFYFWHTKSNPPYPPTYLPTYPPTHLPTYVPPIENTLKEQS